jgi:hypothetical protein
LSQNFSGTFDNILSINEPAEMRIGTRHPAVHRSYPREQESAHLVRSTQEKKMIALALRAVQLLAERGI